MKLPVFQRRLAARVCALREERGLNQDDLEDFDLSWKCVQKLEYGLTDPKASTLLKLCQAFKMTLPELLCFDSGEPARSSASDAAAEDKAAPRDG